MKLDRVRKLALSLPDTTEEPHHNYSSFRVRGKIFVTVPPDQEHIHIFVDELTREHAVAANAEFVEKLFWGGKAVGIRVSLAAARPGTVLGLVKRAYAHKASPARARRHVGSRQTASG